MMGGSPSFPNQRKMFVVSDSNILSLCNCTCWLPGCKPAVGSDWKGDQANRSCRKGSRWHRKAARQAMALTLGMAGLAQAGCTAEEAQQKAATFAQVVQAKAQQDPEGYAKVMQELQPELLQIQQKQDVDALCAFYDKAIAKLK